MDHEPHESDQTQPEAEPRPEQPAAPGAEVEPARQRASTGRTLLIAGAAAAVFGAGGLGVGLLVAPHHNDATSSPSTSVFGNGYGDLPSAGGWSAQDLPWTGLRQVPDTAQAGQGTRTANADEISGLVRIHTTINFGQGEAAGTGMVLTSDGEVVTNHHVVQGATSISVTVPATGRSYRADLVGTDAKADVALLRLRDAAGLVTVRPDTGAVRVGDEVTAVGDAGGSTSFTAAPGSVSATGQRITTQGDAAGAGETLTGLIEITSDVAPGDSGGATYDAAGDVLGMTTAASSDGAQVDGYAIPIRTVLSIADDLARHVHRASYAYGYPAFLGVALAPGGTTVQNVYAGSAAARAGIDAGDRITQVDSIRTATATALGSAIRAHRPGNEARVTWTGTDGHASTATVTLGQGPVG